MPDPKTIIAALGNSGGRCIVKQYSNKGRPTLDNDIESERLALYEAGATDVAIGLAQDRSSVAICKWRQRRGLPLNHR